MAPGKLTKGNNKTQATKAKTASKAKSSQRSDPKLVFLWLCLRYKKDSGTVDYDAVGRALGIKPMAASMRYSRLKKELDKELEKMGGPEKDNEPSPGKEAVDRAPAGLCNTKDVSEQDIKVKPEPDEILDFIMDDEC